VQYDLVTHPTGGWTGLWEIGMNGGYRNLLDLNEVHGDSEDVETAGVSTYEDYKDMLFSDKRPMLIGESSIIIFNPDYKMRYLTQL